MLKTLKLSLCNKLNMHSSEEEEQSWTVQSVEILDLNLGYVPGKLWAISYELTRIPMKIKVAV